jgi:hypothetical protein
MKFSCSGLCMACSLGARRPIEPVGGAGAADGDGGSGGAGGAGEADVEEIRTGLAGAPTRGETAYSEEAVTRDMGANPRGQGGAML